MFYAHFVLSKKGPLARIWLAAHWDKKLTRAQIFETNITSSVEAILEPKVKLALRTSGHLLLGVVRIYSRKAKYLLADCNEAFVKIKMAFRPGVVDLPDEANREAAIAAITLPENIHDFEATIADLNELDMSTIAINQSRPEDITMREDFGEINLGRQDDDFGDSTYEEQPLGGAGGEAPSSVLSLDVAGMTPSLRSSSGTIIGTSLHRRRRHTSQLEGEEAMEQDEEEALDVVAGASIDREYEGLGEVEEMEVEGEVAGSRHKRAALAAVTADTADRDRDRHAHLQQDDEFGEEFLGGADDDSDDSLGGAIDHDLFVNEASLTEALFDDPSAQKQLETITSEIVSHMDAGHLLEPPTPAPPETPTAGVDVDAGVEDAVGSAQTDKGLAPDQEVGARPASAVADGTGTTTLLASEMEAFALPPVEATVLAPASVSLSAVVSAGAGEGGRRGGGGGPGSRRRRRLIIDEQKSIPSEVMKVQMQDTSDITTQLDLAPPTKKLMYWKETGGVDRLFTMPGRAIPSRVLLRLFTRNLHTVAVPDDAAPDEQQQQQQLGGAGFEEDEGEVPVSGPAPVYFPPQQQQTVRSLLLDDLMGPPSVPPPAQPATLPLPPPRAPTPAASPPSAPMLTAADVAGPTPTPGTADLEPATPQEIQRGTSGDSTPFFAAHLHRDPYLVEPASAGPASHAGITMTTPGSLSVSGVGAGIPCLSQHATPAGTVVEDDMPSHQELVSYLAPDTPYLQPPSVLSEVPASVLQNDLRILEQELIAAGEMDDDDEMAATGNMLTEECLEERRLEKRSKVMLRILRANFQQRGDRITLLPLCVSNSKKQAASKFYTLLLLRKQGAVELMQTEPFEDITITSGANFSRLLDACG